MITVIGWDGGPLARVAARRLAAARMVVASASQLSTIDAPADAERVVLGDVPAAVARLAAHPGPAVVVASGDPGFFGLLRLLRRAGLAPRVLPAPSSVAVAFARLGLPWDDAVVVSAHGHAGGRSLRRAVNVCRAYPKVAILTGPGAGPAELRAALPGRRLVVASRLGTADERIADIAAGPWPEPTVVLALSDVEPDRGPGVESCVVAEPESGVWPDATIPSRGDVAEQAPWLAGRPPAPAGWALPDPAFGHRDGMLTKAEVRALVLARLGPRIGDLVWDIGSGSGSVAVECARLGAATIAVDRDLAACELVRRNAIGFGVPVEVVRGTAPAVLAGLPAPDAVFVGGGGIAVLDACLSHRPARLVASYADVDRIGRAVAALARAGYRADGAQIQASRLVPVPGGGHRLAALNPVTVVWAVPE
jgi:precorrin-6B C5,15-methyltransferase / cobalt-precorrin-6B C5,C15-methyltransferase